jgi:hypothetical protein
MNLNEFVGSINYSGVSRTSYFDVLVKKPEGVGNDEARDMVMRINSVDLPGRNVATEESMYSGYPHKIATGATVSELNCTIILSEDLREKEFFETWIDKIVGPHRTGELTGNMFNLGYYNSYIGEAEITNYNELNEPRYRVKLIDAYPTTIGNVSLTWDSGNEINILPVAFTYRYYTTEKL